MSSTGNHAAIVVSCLALLAGLSGCVSSEPVEPADLVLRGGVIVTVDDALPEAEAIAVAGYKIAAVGSDRAINAYVGRDTKVIDLAGRLAIPGLIEGHGHFMSMGWAKMNLDLTEASTWDEIVELAREAAREAEPGDWIFGWAHVQAQNILEVISCFDPILHHVIESITSFGRQSGLAAIKELLNDLHAVFVSKLLNLFLLKRN